MTKRCKENRSFHPQPAGEWKKIFKATWDKMGDITYGIIVYHMIIWYMQEIDHSLSPYFRYIQVILCIFLAGSLFVAVRPRRLQEEGFYSVKHYEVPERSALIYRLMLFVLWCLAIYLPISIWFFIHIHISISHMIHVYIYIYSCLYLYMHRYTCIYTVY